MRRPPTGRTPCAASPSHEPSDDGDQHRGAGPSNPYWVSSYPEMTDSNNPLSWQYIRVPLAIIACFSLFLALILLGSTQPSQPVWRRILIPIGYSAILLPFWIAVRAGSLSKQHSVNANSKAPGDKNRRPSLRFAIVGPLSAVFFGLLFYFAVAEDWAVGGAVFCLFLFLAAVRDLRSRRFRRS